MTGSPDTRIFVAGELSCAYRMPPWQVREYCFRHASDENCWTAKGDADLVESPSSSAVPVVCAGSPEELELTIAAHGMVGVKWLKLGVPFGIWLRSEDLA